MVAKAILCGVLLVCNYVPRDQQTAALDSYVANLQGGLAALQANVARLQRIQTNVNDVWQQDLTIAQAIPDVGFVNALNTVKTQLDKYFAAYITDATTILGSLDTWIKNARSTYLTKTASYQTPRGVLMASFDSSIAAGPGMARSCAQHYYAQFEGIEYNFLLTIGKAYSTAAGTLATQSAAINLLLNVMETDFMRQIYAFQPDLTLLQDAIDNWSTVYNRIALTSTTSITDLRTAVQGVMTTVDAAIVLPGTLLTSVNQVKSAYALCTRMG